MLKHLNRIYATWFYLGLIPKAPGTWGSLGGLIMIIALLLYWFDFTGESYGIISHLCIFVFLLITGIFSANKYDRDHQTHDSKQIVIDEVAGIMLAFLPTLFLRTSWFQANVPELHQMIYQIFGPSVSSILYFLLSCLIVQFFLFRFFDVLKPWPVGLIDRKLKGGMGVMMDDVAAGIMAAMTFILLGIVAYYWGLVLLP